MFQNLEQEYFCVANVSEQSGVTLVDDLGKKDRKMLTTLAHLELMMLFDECSITYSRKKPRRKGSGISSLCIYLINYSYISK